MKTSMLAYDFLAQGRVIPGFASAAAAEAMRRIVGDSALGGRLAKAGRRTMEQQPSLADTGRLISQLLLGGK